MPKKRSPRIVRLRGRLSRRIGRLVVTLTPDGLLFRGKHKRTYRSGSWAQVASLAAGAEPIFVAEETSRGLRALESMGADPTIEEA